MFHVTSKSLQKQKHSGTIKLFMYYFRLRVDSGYWLAVSDVQAINRIREYRLKTGK